MRLQGATTTFWTLWTFFISEILILPKGLCYQRELMELRRDIPFLLPGAFLIRDRGKGKNFSWISPLFGTDNAKKLLRKNLLDILVATMAIPVLPWRHRYSAPAAAPGRFTESERLSPTAHQHGMNQEFFVAEKTGPALLRRACFTWNNFGWVRRKDSKAALGCSQGIAIYGSTD